MANVSGQNLASADVLFSKENWVVGDFTGTQYLGRDGTITTTAANALLWDARLYRQVQLVIKMHTLTGAAIEWSLEHHGRNSPSDEALGSTYATMPDGGGGLVLTLGGNAIWNSATAAFFSGHGAGAPYVPPFVRVRFWTNGTVTAVSGSNYLYLYGLR